MTKNLILTGLIALFLPLFASAQSQKELILGIPKMDIAKSLPILKQQLDPVGAKITAYCEKHSCIAISYPVEMNKELVFKQLRNELGLPVYEKQATLTDLTNMCEGKLITKL